jgi:hypothetical protein
VSDPPLIPAALYGLRTWRWAADAEGECLVGAYDDTRWPDGGEWLHASCSCADGHAAPAPDCTCGIHAWHPDRTSARRVLASRFVLPGVVEAAGAVQVHEEGFRAERARPYALLVTPGRNAGLVRRLGERYGAEVVEARGADALLGWCRDRELGLERAVVEQLLGPGELARRREARRRRGRRDLVKVLAYAALAAVALLIGIEFASGPPSPKGVYGRTGWVVPPAPERRAQPPAAAGARETNSRARSTCRHGGRGAEPVRKDRRQDQRAEGQRCGAQRRTP